MKDHIILDSQLSNENLIMQEHERNHMYMFKNLQKQQDSIFLEGGPLEFSHQMFQFKGRLFWVKHIIISISSLTNVLCRLKYQKINYFCSRHFVQLSMIIPTLLTWDFIHPRRLYTPIFNTWTFKITLKRSNPHHVHIT